MPRKIQPKVKSRKEETMTWEKFLQEKEKYVGKIVELTLETATCSGTISRLETENNVLVCFCTDCYVFKGSWQHKSAEETRFFEAPMSDDCLPVDKGNGTIKIITMTQQQAFLKLAS